MKFKYKKYSPQILRPVIPIDISYKEKSIRHEVLIDSGADKNILNAEMGEYLGINVKKGRISKVAGITGVGEPYYLHSINITLGGYTYRIETGFKYEYRWSFGLLGQMGFFNLFIVKFDYRKGEIEIFPRKEIN